MLAALRVDAVAFGGLRVTVADVAALGALAAILLALARGRRMRPRLQTGGGTGVFLLLLPGLVLFVLAVAAARLLSPILRLLELAARPGKAVCSRRAALTRARAGEVSLTVVFFVLSVGIAVFAFAYRDTLVQGEHEQAQCAVPAPCVPWRGPWEARHDPAGGDGEVAPRARQVVRESGYVSGNHGRDFTLLALPARSLVDRRLARRLLVAVARGARTPAAAGKHAVTSRDPLPAAAPTLTLPFTTTGDQVGLTAII